MLQCVLCVNFSQVLSPEMNSLGPKTYINMYDMLVLWMLSCVHNEHYEKLLKMLLNAPVRPLCNFFSDLSLEMNSLDPKTLCKDVIYVYIINTLLCSLRTSWKWSKMLLNAPVRPPGQFFSNSNLRIEFLGSNNPYLHVWYVNIMNTLLYTWRKGLEMPENALKCSIASRTSIFL